MVVFVVVASVVSIHLNARIAFRLDVSCIALLRILRRGHDDVFAQLQPLPASNPTSLVWAVELHSSQAEAYKACEAPIWQIACQSAC